MILDVGCGHLPRGDVNVDLLIDDSKRGWNRDVSGYKNFVKADVRFLPFKSGIFDLVYSSHLIEHLEDEWEGINEMKRVSRKYVAVIVPWAGLLWLYEFLWNLKGFPEHWRWLKKHHKHNWNMDPFRTGCFKLRWRRAPSDRSRLNKFKVIASRIPVPFETYTLWDVSNDE